MSKTTGVIRGFDKLGRFVIPSEMVKTLELDKDDKLEISCDGTTIYLRKYQPYCNFCGDVGDGLTEVMHKRICTNCMNEIIRTTAN
ncbi:AbrB/MazE/SpoVT family DNA-binding domain-containing protein [Halalkalibacter alkaliphilus]|uniref:AbrB/MazE/SpoVT family DNA-binding domain-containing protein n=1 Tax=Halalkalibacter alkaliphilus TaxID=2917993 RepID=A0A9X2CVS8_9BACI|nr:AbrB/MazE/SpoVT family DNA-binding domain-containing protein [Halalkalibacter alkaliphilus]MCL7749205.1 AbrB/MazE/SpoVT family DNA-binding domain-containing protein [Halalkalibacter alkaliphilus]